MPGILPYLGVYFVRESLSTDGDLNAGEVRFRNKMTVGFSIVVQNNDPVQSRLKLDQGYWEIKNGLWRDQYIMNLIDYQCPAGVITLPDGLTIEGIKGGTCRYNWGNAGRNNETPIAELQYEAIIVYREAFPPIITDDLLRIHVGDGAAGERRHHQAGRRSAAHHHRIRVYPACRQGRRLNPRHHRQPRSESAVRRHANPREDIAMNDKTEGKKSLRKQQLEDRREKMKKLTPKVERVRVSPASEELRQVLKHPKSGVKFPASGSVEWPLDQFTRRRIKEGSVTREDDRRQQGQRRDQRPPHARPQDQRPQHEMHESAPLPPPNSPPPKAT